MLTENEKKSASLPFDFTSIANCYPHSQVYTRANQYHV